MPVRVADEVGAREPEQRPRGLWPALLDMDERSGQLDQALEEIAVRALPHRQPERLQLVVGFVIELAIEAIEKRPVARLAAAPIVSGRRAFEFGAFVQHAPG
jgi:hypothetical protein